MNNKDVTVDWYKKAFLHGDLSKGEIAINSGLNMKTIGNMFNSTSRQVVIDASNEHYETLYNSTKTLVKKEHELELITAVNQYKWCAIAIHIVVNKIFNNACNC